MDSVKWTNAQGQNFCFITSSIPVLTSMLPFHVNNDPTPNSSLNCSPNTGFTGLDLPRCCFTTVPGSFAVKNLPGTCKDTIFEAVRSPQTPPRPPALDRWALSAHWVAPWPLLSGRRWSQRFLLEVFQMELHKSHQLDMFWFAKVSVNQVKYFVSVAISWNVLPTWAFPKDTFS